MVSPSGSESFESTPGALKLTVPSSATLYESPAAVGAWLWGPITTAYCPVGQVGAVVPGLKYILPSEDFTQKYSESESAGTLEIVFSLVRVVLPHVVDAETLRVTPFEV